MKTPKKTACTSVAVTKTFIVEVGAVLAFGVKCSRGKLGCGREGVQQQLRGRVHTVGHCAVTETVIKGPRGGLTRRSASYTSVKIGVWIPGACANVCSPAYDPSTQEGKTGYPKLAT